MEAMAVLRPLRELRAGSERRAATKSAEPVAESRLQDFVVITGFSGAGKSTAMNVFEDAGY
ncbi:MAG TPA: RNase adaptor protein RapZ, partial [Solirubrobacteraceae bacterium]|nr:RNase adaptor protein RapZ [Solirubrobacteraceae bacterium]